MFTKTLLTVFVVSLAQGNVLVLDNSNFDQVCGHERIPRTLARREVTMATEFDTFHSHFCFCFFLMCSM